MREEEGPGCKRVGGPLRPDVLRVLLGQVYVGLLQDQHTPFIIIITKPKPAYGRQGLAGLWGQDTDEGGTFWDVLNVSLRASGAQLGYKLTWNHKKTNLES